MVTRRSFVFGGGLSATVAAFLGRAPLAAATVNTDRRTQVLSILSWAFEAQYSARVLWAGGIDKRVWQQTLESTAVSMETGAWEELAFSADVRSFYEAEIDSFVEGFDPEVEVVSTELERGSRTRLACERAGHVWDAGEREGALAHLTALARAEFDGGLLSADGQLMYLWLLRESGYSSPEAAELATELRAALAASLEAGRIPLAGRTDFELSALSLAIMIVGTDPMVMSDQRADGGYAAAERPASNVSATCWSLKYGVLSRVPRLMDAILFLAAAQRADGFIATAEDSALESNAVAAGVFGRIYPLT